MTEYTANEMRRIISMIPETDPTTTEYHILLQSLECFAGIADSIEEIMAEIDYEPPAAEDVTKVTLHPALEKALSEKAGKTPDEPEQQVIPEPEEVQPVEEITYDLITVRQAMRDAKKRGVDIVALIKDLGATNLTDLPAEKYGELMKRLEE